MIVNTPTNIDAKIGDLFITERKIILMLSNDTNTIRRPDIKVFFSKDGVRSSSTVEWHYFKQSNVERVR